MPDAGARLDMKYGNSISRCDVAALQLALQLEQDVPDVLHMNDAAVRVEHFDEPAHVRALEFLRQVHEQPDRRHGVLHRVRLVAHLDGKAQSAHAHLVNAQFAMVALALFVLQLRARFGSFNHTGSTHEAHLSKARI